MQFVTISSSMSVTFQLSYWFMKQMKLHTIREDLLVPYVRDVGETMYGAEHIKKLHNASCSIDTTGWRTPFLDTIWCYVDSGLKKLHYSKFKSKKNIHMRTAWLCTISVSLSSCKHSMLIMLTQHVQVRGRYAILLAKFKSPFPLILMHHDACLESSSV